MPPGAARTSVLDLLRQSSADYLSGSELSALLGVSRSAVWKQIGQLRRLGYRIEAIPSRGYRLCASPDLPLVEEVRQGLAVRVIGRELRYLAETDSTNRQAVAAAEAGAAEGLVIVAEEQSAGRGRLGRTWVSPPGVNLYLSVLLRPPLPPYGAPQLTFLSALAVARAIEALSGLQPTLKWPNDVLIDDRKVCGILASSDGSAVVVGMGVNTTMDASELPVPHATSLLLAGLPTGKDELVAAVLVNLEQVYARWQANGDLRGEYQAACGTIGRSVRVQLDPRRSVHGVATGVDRAGNLVVSTAEGERSFAAGDVHHLR